MNKRLLIVEDEKDISDFISHNLTKRGFEITVCNTGKSGLEASKASTFDLIILDWMLPEMEGIDVLTHIRKSGNHTPTLMLTAKDTEIDRVLGLEMGADDYLTKPFSIAELEARLRSMLRRAVRYNTPPANADDPTNDILLFEDLKLDANKRQLYLNDAPLTLTSKEYELLEFFMRNPGKAFTRQELLDHIWGTALENYEHAVNCHINRLRQKIEGDPKSPHYIQTVWGIGYRFSDNSQDSATQ